MTFEYEKYELRFSHYITETTGRNVELDEPIMVALVTPIGAPTPVSMILERMIWDLKRTIEAKNG